MPARTNAVHLRWPGPHAKALRMWPMSSMPCCAGQRMPWKKAIAIAWPEAKRLDGTLDRLNTAIKEYRRGSIPNTMAEADVGVPARGSSPLRDQSRACRRRGPERNILGIASKRLKRGLQFSPEGLAEILQMVERLTGNLRAAAAVFMTEDMRAARALADEKEAFRDMEASATEAHFARLRAGAYRHDKEPSSRCIST